MLLMLAIVCQTYANSPQEYNRFANDFVKYALYTSIGQCIDFNAIDSLYPTSIFEDGWIPNLPDGFTKEDYYISLTVK